MVIPERKKDALDRGVKAAESARLVRVEHARRHLHDQSQTHGFPKLDRRLHRRTQLKRSGPSPIELETAAETLENGHCDRLLGEGINDFAMSDDAMHGRVQIDARKPRSEPVRKRRRGFGELDSILGYFVGHDGSAFRETVDVREDAAAPAAQ